jgi:hypothetical protein
VRHAEVGVHRQCAFVVLSSPGSVTERAVGVAEADVGAGPLVEGAGIADEGKGGGVMSERFPWVVGGLGGLAQAVERSNFTVPVVEVPEDGESLPVVLDGLAEIAQPSMDGAEFVQCPGLTGSIAEPTEEGKCLLQVIGGLVVSTQPLIHAAEVGQRVRLTVSISELAEQCQSLVLVVGGQRIAATSFLDDAETVQRIGLPYPGRRPAGRAPGPARDGRRPLGSGRAIVR